MRHLYWRAGELPTELAPKPKNGVERLVLDREEEILFVLEAYLDTDEELSDEYH